MKDTPSLELTKAELQALTSYKQVPKMLDWLRANGWVHMPPARRGDVPKVARAYYLERMTGRAPEGQRRRNGPDLSCMLGGPPGATPTTTPHDSPP